MNDVNVVIVDDEALARINVREALSRYPHWHIVAELSSAKEIDSVITRLQPDVLFLDIKMPGKQGVEVAEELMVRPDCPLVVFITAFDAYAVQAFELYALDYLLKPFDNDRFRQVVERVEQSLLFKEKNKRVEKIRQHGLLNNKWLENILIRSVGSIRIVAMTDIYWFCACGNYVEVHHSEGMHLHRVGLSFLEKHIDPRVFIRVHRSAIVKISEIREFNTLDDNKYQIILSHDAVVKVSPTYKNELLSRLGMHS